MPDVLGPRRPAELAVVPRHNPRRVHDRRRCARRPSASSIDFGRLAMLLRRLRRTGRRSARWFAASSCSVAVPVTCTPRSSWKSTPSSTTTLIALVVLQVDHLLRDVVGPERDLAVEEHVAHRDDVRRAVLAHRRHVRRRKPPARKAATSSSSILIRSRIDIVRDCTALPVRALQVGPGGAPQWRTSRPMRTRTRLVGAVAALAALASLPLAPSATAGPSCGTARGRRVADLRSRPREHPDPAGPAGRSRRRRPRP